MLQVGATGIEEEEEDEEEEEEEEEEEVSDSDHHIEIMLDIVCRVKYD
jgi:hypothetical protein